MTNQHYSGDLIASLTRLVDSKFASGTKDPLPITAYPSATGAFIGGNPEGSHVHMGGDGGQRVSKDAKPAPPVVSVDSKFADTCNGVLARSAAAVSPTTGPESANSGKHSENRVLNPPKERGISAADAFDPADACPCCKGIGECAHDCDLAMSRDRQDRESRWR